MITIVTTRFSNKTWEENTNYRKKNSCTGCIYGSPQEFSPKILYDSTIFVIEMNNNTNQIEGIGLVKNRPFLDKYYLIHSEGNYNRYVYKSKYYLDRDIIIRNNNILLDTLEYIVFKEKTHLKRGSGFTSVTQDLLKKKKNEKYQNLDLQKIIKNIVDCFLSLNNTNLS
jgi:hypothetical protein